ncbi:MAG: pentapeptide repeat-containing protein, partial [Nostoc sp.]
KTAAGSDKSQLSAEYFDDYNQLKALSQSQQLLLVEKSDRIRNLEIMVNTGLGQSKYNIQGNPVMSDISGISIQGSSNVSGIAGGGSVANLGTISGNVSIALNQLPDSADAEKPGIKELLTQLQEAISQSADLAETDKADALLQVEALAEAAKNPQEST